ncbi:MAG: tRNA lysidine(34) synthetase TilS [Vampirovibrionales bacterium]|nr:tRNA lysidine(34) synthetase TilS [Vampirovibrionales bacterium]
MSSPATPPPLSLPLVATIHTWATRIRTEPNAALPSAAFGLAAPQPTWLVAYSGGVDSTALLYALHQWQQAQPQETTPRIVAVMVHHGWRPTPTPELADAMAQCKAWQIPLVLVPISKTTKLTETEARTARYEALKTVAQREKATAIWLAHHSDDQLETMLIRLCRGTGLEGIQGMTPVSPLMGAEAVLLVRPWLGFTKQTLIEYATTHGLKYHTDATNADTIHPRNHLRHNVLPALEQAFPQAKESLLRFQTVASETTELAECAIADVWPTIWDKTLGLDTTRLSQCSPSFQGALIRQFLKHHHLLCDYAPVQRVRAFITGTCNDTVLDPSTTRGSLLSVERPSRSLSNTEKLDHWFLNLSQHRLTLISKAPSSSSIPEVILSAPTENNSAVIKPLAFRLMDLFPLRRPPAVVASSEDEDDASETSPLGSLLLGDALDEEPLLEPSLSEPNVGLLANEAPLVEASEETLTPSDLVLTEESETLTHIPKTPPQEARPKIQTLCVSSGDEFMIERLTGDDIIPYPLPAGESSTVYVTLEPFLVETLALRTERSGDRFHPLGSLTSMRLSSYLASKHALSQGKTSFDTPLLACGDEILWAVGVGVAEALRVTRRPTHRLTWVSAATTPAASSPIPQLATV